MYIMNERHFQITNLISLSTKDKQTLSTIAKHSEKHTQEIKHHYLLKDLGVEALAICRVFKKQTTKAMFYSDFNRKNCQYLYQFFNLQLWKHPVFKSAENKLPHSFTTYTKVCARNEKKSFIPSLTLHENILPADTNIYLFEERFRTHKDIFVFYLKAPYIKQHTSTKMSVHTQNLSTKLTQYIHLAYLGNHYPLFIVDFPVMDLTQCKNDLHFLPRTGRPSASPPKVPLTEKQQLYAQYIKLGYSNKQIANKANKAVRTIEDAISELKYIAGVQTKEQLSSFLQIFL